MPLHRLGGARRTHAVQFVTNGYRERRADVADYAAYRLGDAFAHRRSPSDVHR